METQKLEKNAAPPARRFRLTVLAAFAAAAFLLAAGFYRTESVLKRNWEDIAERWRSLLYDAQRDNDDLRLENAALRRRLDEMTATAGAYRAYEVYHDCVQQNLGIYRMKEVARAYDRHFRSTELTTRCLAESEWYETHPLGINPAHLNH